MALETDEATLQLAYEEAQIVLDRYFVAINNIEAKTTHMTILSTTVLGVLLSAIVVLATNGLSTWPDPRKYLGSQIFIFALIVGALANATSLVLALATARGGGIAVGLKSDALEAVRSRPPPKHEYLSAAIGAYIEAIQSYHRLSAVMNRRFSQAKSAFLAGLASALAGTAIFIIFQGGGGI